MPIVPSRSVRIQELLSRLGSADGREREAALAGLALVGARVIEPLRAFLPGAGEEARRAAVSVLEGLDAPPALALLLELAGDPDEGVALRAIEAAGARPSPRPAAALARLLAGRASRPRRRAAALALVRLQAAGLVEALDPLAARLLDEREDPSLRAAILDALLALDPPLREATLRPLLRRLAASTVPELSARAGAALESGPPPDQRLVTRLVAPGTPAEERARLVSALGRQGAPAIPLLMRALESLGPPPRGRADPEALRARAAVHEALATLGSRVALFDLREALEARPRAVLPDLLRAAARVGDASLVPALARVVAEDAALAGPCAEALRAIVAREKLRRTSAAVKAVRPEHRAALDALWPRAGRPRGGVSRSGGGRAR